ncbi:TPA: fimbrial protein [Stenotrophomonas maltophilia]|uniref:CS1 type fimbrial major subunit n=1 Tax=Stenotrophomonas sp. Sm6012 TaxID=3002745 RepID=UPI0013107A22|nr:CS1 type fimbrial major subunit [Stenotrophomonas sp. Sm6012]MDQ7281272.1 CS1 type fimbrial major subunit [Stenotrophomonas sp. Sm6012]HEL3180181.1 fimbrial protein [Stenotrophomonas maltophilia]
MNGIIKKAALAAALATASLSAQAVETRISVYANVDSTLAFQQEDGTALPDVITLNYHPEMTGTGGRVGGLQPWKLPTRIFTNDEDKDIEVSLRTALELVPTLGNVGATPVPMTVSLDDVELTTASQDFKAADLFDGAVPGVSKPLDLKITQTTPGPLAAGTYNGMVAIVMAQKTGTP